MSTGLQNNSSLLANNRVRYVVIVVAAIALINIGFLRDHIFTNINTLAGHPTGGVNTAKELFTLHHNIVKAALTLLFSILYIGISCLIIYLLYKKRSFVVLTFFLHVLFIVSAPITVGIGYLAGQEGSSYPIARDLVGLAQSPVITMILALAFKLQSNLPKV